MKFNDLMKTAHKLVRRRLKWCLSWEKPVSKAIFTVPNRYVTHYIYSKQFDLMWHIHSYSVLL